MNLLPIETIEQEYVPPYCWSQDDWIKVHSKNGLKLKDVFEISLKVVYQIREHASPTGLVIGPMVTGGYDPVKNLEIFEAAIQIIRLKGVAVFNQLHLLPFLDFYMDSHQPQYDFDQYPCEVMTELFLPLIRNGKFQRVFVIEGWQSSRETNMEMELCKEMNLIPELVPLRQIRQYLA
jgi:hypothetical protein